MKKHLDVDIEIVSDTEFAITFCEPESGSTSIIYYHDDGTPAEDKRIIAEIRSWLSILREENDFDIDEAKATISSFLISEFGDDVDLKDTFKDLSNVPVAYTITEDEKHEIQVSLDLVNFKFNKYVDGKLIKTEKYKNLIEMKNYCLDYLDYDYLVYIPDQYPEI